MRFSKGIVKQMTRIHYFVILIYLSTCISFLHAQWESDVRLGLGNTNAYTSFNNAWSIAAKGDTVHAVWFDTRHVRPNYEIYYRRSQDGGANWEPETRLTNDTCYSGYSSVAVSGQNVHIVWFDNRSGNEDIYYKRSTDAGTTWGPDTQLTTSPVIQDFPSVAVWWSDIHVVFSDERNGNWEIYYMRSTDGGDTWEPETRLTDDPAWSCGACIAVNGQNVHLVWSDDRALSAYFDVYYKRSTDGGTTWGPDTRLTYDFSGYTPCVALSRSNVYVVWQDERDGNYEIYFKRSTNNGIDWEPDVRLTNDPAISYIPSMAASDSNVHIAWYDYQSSILAEIYYKRSTDNGITWEPDLRLTNDSLRSWWPTIAVGDSAVHIVWTDDRPGYYNVYYKRNPTGNPSVITENAVKDLTQPTLVATPNPFVSFARVLDHEKELFIVYDVSGKQTSICRGNRIGENLAAGVYFITNLSKNITRIRVVKIK